MRLVAKCADRKVGLARRVGAVEDEVISWLREKRKETTVESEVDGMCGVNTKDRLVGRSDFRATAGSDVAKDWKDTKHGAARMFHTTGGAIKTGGLVDR